MICIKIEKEFSLISLSKKKCLAFNQIFKESSQKIHLRRKYAIFIHFPFHILIIGIVKKYHNKLCIMCSIKQ